MKVITAQQMSNIIERDLKFEQLNQDDLNFSVARALMKHVLKDQQKEVFIAAGSGIEGDYAMALAHLLSNQPGIKVKLASNSIQGHRYHLMLLDDGVEILETQRIIKNEIENSGLIIDCIGDDSKYPYPYWIKWINEAQGFVISCDIPSGINGENGSINREAVFADLTVCLQLPKLALYLYPGSDHAGKVVKEDIGLSSNSISSVETKIQLNQLDEILSMLPPRYKHSHKGSYGKVLLIAGCEATSGAALLCGKSILKTGAGLLTVMSYPSVIDLVKNNLFEAMSITIDEEHFQDQLNKLDLSKYSLIVLGPGLGVNHRTDLLLQKVLKSDLPCVIDADGLYYLGKHLELLKRNAFTVITPHEVEFARIFDFERKNIIPQLQQIATRYPNLIVVFKGEHSLIANQSLITINTTGNSTLAKGGSGDVLAGVIGGFLAQQCSYDSVVAAVYIHSLAADYWLKNNSAYSLLASELIEKIDEVILEITRGKNYE